MAQKEEAEALRLVVVFLRYYSKKTQAEFGRDSQVDQTYISRYELGKQTPPEEGLRRMAAAAGVPWHIVVQLRRFCASAFSVAACHEMAAPEMDAVLLDRSVLERALLGVAPYFVEIATVDTTQPSPKEERREAEEVWAALKRFPVHRRRRLVELSLRASQSWALAERIGEASVRAAANRADEALTLADLALSIAGRVPGEEGWRSRFQGYAWAFVANARRVANDFEGADEAFAQAWELWRAGTGSDLLPEWRLLDLEASLRREQHRFPEALALLDRAGILCGHDNKAAAGRILLKKEHVFEQTGDIEGALCALAEAAPFIEVSGDPRLIFAHRFKTTNNLCHLRRYEEAAKLLPEVNMLVAQQGSDLSSLRVLWLEARVLAGLGQTNEAAAALEQVQRELTIAHDLPYDAALSSLDLAVLWLEAGRSPEVRELALGMAWIFASKKIDREALAALRLFYEAARQERATVELARRVIAKIEEVSRSVPRT
jgi:transcriptional regulator with XRE-family HTH domain